MTTYLSVAEYAALIGMGADWVYDEIHAGRLTHTRFGRKIRFTPADIEANAQAHQRGPVARIAPARSIDDARRKIA